MKRLWVALIVGIVFISVLVLFSTVASYNIKQSQYFKVATNEISKSKQLVDMIGEYRDTGTFVSATYSDAKNTEYIDLKFNVIGNKGDADVRVALKKLGQEWIIAILEVNEQGRWIQIIDKE